MKMKTEEIKERTAELYRQIALSSTPDNYEILQEIYFINQYIVINELKQIQKRYAPDFYLRIADDLEQALSEKLWIAINKYEPQKNVSLYTFCGKYMKEAVRTICTDEIYQGAMSPHYATASKRLNNLINEEAVTTGRIDYNRIKEKLLSEGFSEKTLEVLSKINPGQNNIAIHTLDFTNADSSSYKTEEEVFTQLDNSLIDCLWNSYKDKEPILREILKMLLEGDFNVNKIQRIIVKKYPGIGQSKAKKLMNRVNQDIIAFYCENYGKYPKLCKRCKELSEELKTYNCLKQYMSINKIEYPIDNAPIEEIQMEVSENDDDYLSSGEPMQLNETFSYEDDFSFEVIDLDDDGKEEYVMDSLPFDLPFKSDESKAAARDIAIDAAVEAGVESYIKKKVLKKLGEMSISDIETIVEKTLEEI